MSLRGSAITWNYVSLFSSKLHSILQRTASPLFNKTRQLEIWKIKTRTVVGSNGACWLTGRRSGSSEKIIENWSSQHIQVLEVYVKTWFCDQRCLNWFDWSKSLFFTPNTRVWKANLTRLLWLDLFPYQQQQKWK